MKTKRLPWTHLEKSPFRKHFHFQSCSWLSAGLENRCASGQIPPWEKSWEQAPGTQKAQTSSSARMYGWKRSVPPGRQPATCGLLSRLRVNLKCIASAFMPPGRQVRMYWQGRLPLPSSEHSEPLAADASLRFRCSRVPGSATPLHPSQLAWVFANCYPDSYVLRHKCPRLKTQIKIRRPSEESGGYDSTVRHQSW